MYNCALHVQLTCTVCRTCKMIMDIQSPGILRRACSSILEDIHRYSWILMHIQPHSQVTACPCHVTYAFQSESTLYSRLNVKKLLAQSRHKIWTLSDCNWTGTHNHLVHKQSTASLAKWLSVHLWTKWLWVLVQLQSHPQVGNLMGEGRSPLPFLKVEKEGFFCSGICLHIQSYLALLRHVYAYRDIIKAYSDLFRHIQYPVQPLAYSQFCLILSPGVPEAYLKPCEELTIHNQNLAKEHYWTIFRHI